MTARPHSPLPSMLLALSAFASFAIGDATVRSMAGVWPGTAVALLRYGAASIGLLIFVLWRHGRAGFAMASPLLQIGRGATMAFGGTMFWVSLSYMPLADATAIQFTNPVWTAMLSALFLGEAIGWRQLLLVLLAFGGVLIVLQPNVVAIGPAALLPLASAFGMATLIVLNRVLGHRGTVAGNQFWLAFFAGLILIPLTFIGQYSGVDRLVVSWPSALTVAKCLFIAGTGTLGHALLYRATLHGSAAAMAPMGYVQILFAVIIGWLAFATPPKPSMLLGGAIIVAAGWMLIRTNMRMAQAIGETGTAPD